MPARLPKLRQVEAFPLRHEERDLICLRDPLGFNEQVVTVSREALLILQCLDGEHTIEEVQAIFVSEAQTQVPASVIEKFVAELDKSLLLETPHFETYRRKLIKDFRAAAVRPAVHAGLSYPAKRPEILTEFAKHGNHSGRSTKSGPPRAIVAPHIDLRHGGLTYAHAYHQLHASEPADLYVILGVAHVPTENRYVGTVKNFATPLGTATTDRAFMERLAKRVPFDLFADELAHRREHSVEFQVVYLQHVLHGHTDYRIAPLLVGSFQDLMESGDEPIGDVQVAAFVAALRETIAESNQRVCVIGGVDLAHVGGRFGDRFTVNDEVLAELGREDRSMLEHVAQLNATKLCHCIYSENDRRRVDGFPAMYTMLHALDLKRGELLHYGQSLEKDTNSVVSFAAMRFD